MGEDIMGGGEDMHGGANGGYARRGVRGWYARKGVVCTEMRPK